MRSVAVFVGALVVVGLAPPVASAQFRRDTSLVMAPPSAITAPGDGWATDLNPAELANLGTFTLTYVHTEAEEGDALVERGDALHTTMALPLGIGVGLSVERLRPTAASGGSDRGVVSLGGAWSNDPRFAAGAALRYFGSLGDDVGGVTALDFAFSVRPTPRLAFSFVAHDVLGPLHLVSEDIDLPATFVFATGFRPWGNDGFTLEGAIAADTERRVGVRAMAELAIPSFGRLHAVAEIDDLADGENLVRFMAGLAVDWGQLGASGGVLGGDGFDDTPGWYLAVSTRGAARRGLPTHRFVDDLELRGGIGARRILAIGQRLERDLNDDRVVGVLLRFRQGGLGLAHAQEIRLLVHQLEEAGKRVVCHLDSASGSELYACAGASQTLIDPAGTIRLLGPSLTSMLYGELLQSVGVRADFVRIGPWKSAVEQYTNRELTAPARGQRDELLDDLNMRLVADLADDLEVSRAQAQALIDEGPYAAEEAQASGLTALEVDELDMQDALREAFGSRYPLRRTPPRRAPDSWGQARRVGVVVIDGTMTDGANSDIPIVEVHTSGGRTITRAIEGLARDPSVAAIVVRIDSPGGSAMASDQIWRALRRAGRNKPVIASMGAVAASGGYYAACAADEIWADPATITGSIGIFFGKVDVAPLAEQVGIAVEQFSRGRRAGATSLYRPFTPDERAELADQIRIWYRLFLRRVAAGRGMTVAEVDAVARGRVFTGDRAQRLGLVDRLGGFTSALARARELADLPADAPVVVTPGRPSSLLDYVIGTVGQASIDQGSIDQPGVDADDVGVAAAPLRRAAGVAAAVAGTAEGVPLALLPGAISVD